MQLKAQKNASLEVVEAHCAYLEHLVVVVAVFEHNLASPCLEQSGAKGPHVNWERVALSNHFEE